MISVRLFVCSAVLGLPGSFMFIGKRETQSLEYHIFEANYSILSASAVADPGFSRRGTPTAKRLADLFPRKLQQIEKKWSGRGGEPCTPLGYANNLNTSDSDNPIQFSFHYPPKYTNHIYSHMTNRI